MPRLVAVIATAARCGGFERVRPHVGGCLDPVVPDRCGDGSDASGGASVGHFAKHPAARVLRESDARDQRSDMCDISGLMYGTAAAGERQSE